MKKIYLLFIALILIVGLAACSSPEDKMVELSFDVGSLTIKDEHAAKWILEDASGTKLAAISLEGGQSSEKDGKTVIDNDEQYSLLIEVEAQYSGKELVVSYNGTAIDLTTYNRYDHRYDYKFKSANADKHTIKIEGLSASKPRMLEIALPKSGNTSTSNESEENPIGYPYITRYKAGEQWIQINNDNVIEVEYNSNVVFSLTFEEDFELIEAVDLLFTSEKVYGEETQSFHQIGDAESVKDISTTSIEYSFTATFDVLDMEVFVY